jgi:hypothetical protein
MEQSKMKQFQTYNFLRNIIMFKAPKDSGLKLLWNTLVEPLCTLPKPDKWLRAYEEKMNNTCFHKAKDFNLPVNSKCPICNSITGLNPPDK